LGSNDQGQAAFLGQHGLLDILCIGSGGFLILEDDRGEGDAHQEKAPPERQLFVELSFSHV